MDSFQRTRQCHQLSNRCNDVCVSLIFIVIMFENYKKLNLFLDSETYENNTFENSLYFIEDEQLVHNI